VFFKSSDVSFQLLLHVIGSEKVFQSESWFVTFGSEFLMNVIICLDPFRGGPGFHWDNLGIIAVINIKYHGVRVALAGSHRKFPRQVRVKLSLVDQDGVNKMGLRSQICVSC
jgi:hypothetical protein